MVESAQDSRALYLIPHELQLGIREVTALSPDPFITQPSIRGVCAPFSLNFKYSQSKDVIPVESKWCHPGGLYREERHADYRVRSSDWGRQSPDFGRYRIGD
jgi:hypothetical protein